MQRDTIKLVSFLLLPVLLIGLFYGFGLNERFAGVYRPAWETWSAGHHWWASIVLFGVFTATSAGGIPRIYPSVLAGGLFSLPLAVVVAVGGATAGSLVPFLIARRLGPRLVEQRFGRRYSQWVQRINASGLAIVLLLRLFPGSNAMLVNMVCGISRLDTGKFVWGTLVGIVPSTIAFVLLGSGLTRDHPVQLGISVLTLAILAAASLVALRGVRHPTPSASAESA